MSLRLKRLNSYNKKSSRITKKLKNYSILAEPVNKYILPGYWAKNN